MFAIKAVRQCCACRKSAHGDSKKSAQKSSVQRTCAACVAHPVLAFFWEFSGSTGDRELGTGTGETGERTWELGTGNLGQGTGGRKPGQQTGDRVGTGNWDRGLETGNWQQTGNRELGNLGQGTGDRELGTGNWRQGRGSKLGTGNLGQGTGDRELGGDLGQGTGGRELGAETGDRELGTGNWGELGAANWGQGISDRRGNWDRGAQRGLQGCLRRGLRGASLKV